MIAVVRQACFDRELDGGAGVWDSENDSEAYLTLPPGLQAAFTPSRTTVGLVVRRSDSGLQLSLSCSRKVLVVMVALLPRVPKATSNGSGNEPKVYGTKTPSAHPRFMSCHELISLGSRWHLPGFHAPALRSFSPAVSRSLSIKPSGEIDWRDVAIIL